MQQSAPDFEALYQTHKDMVYNLALHFVQNIEDAQEITQDVFVAIFQSLSTFKAESTARTWIYRIAVNKSLDFIKSSKRKQRLGYVSKFFGYAPNEEINHPASNNHPGILLENKEDLNRIFEWINELPDKQKTALILHKIEHLPQAEVAVIMNMSPKSIESLVTRAKKNLEKKLGL